MLALLASSATAKATGLLFEDTTVAANYPQLEGSPTWLLEAVVVRADDGQRHPLAVFIAGTPEFSPRPMLHVARELARRGWTTVAVMRPGYAKSEGKEPPSRCGDYASQARFAAQTLRETIRVMSAMPFIDPSRVIALGHSTGAVGAVALTAEPPANLVAAISFAGNNGSQYRAGKLDTVCNSADLLETFEAFGRVSRVPMLWIYAENDHHMGATLAQAYHKAFTDAGGKAAFHLAPATNGDGHQLYAMPEGVAIWTSYLDRFLSDQNLALTSSPLTITLPDITPSMELSDSGRQTLAAYLAAMPHKALAMSRSRWGQATLADSTEAAVTRAMTFCKGSDADPCRIVMIDDRSVP